MSHSPAIPSSDDSDRRISEPGCYPYNGFEKTSLLVVVVISFVVDSHHR